MLSIPSTHSLYSRPPCTFSGRAGLRARICSAFSCDMFARVVWLRLREAAKPPTFDLSFAARTCHAWLARLTRARRTRFGRRTARVLLADFWYFWSCKSTISTKNFLSLFYKRHLIRHASRATFSRWRRLAKILAFVDAQTFPTPAPLFQRACRQCVHESARLFRVICSHAWYS